MSEIPPADPDDGLALALGQFVREHEAAAVDARPPEWEAALGGELSFDDALAARREAGDEEVERAAAHFRPFDSSESDSLVDNLLGSLASAESESESESAAPEAPGGAPLPADELAEVIPLAKAKAKAHEPEPHDPRASSWWVPGGMLAAAAAAILMWWVLPPSDDLRGTGDTGSPKIAQLEPLPAYGIEADPGLAALRGDEGGEEAGAAPLRYHRDTPFRWLLRPAVNVDEPVDVRGFAFVEGGSAGLPLHLEALTERADSGVIRIAGKIAALDLEPGRYTIALALGRPDALPTQAAQVAAPSPEGAWQVHRLEINIED